MFLYQASKIMKINTNYDKEVGFNDFLELEIDESLYNSNPLNLQTYDTLECFLSSNFRFIGNFISDNFLRKYEVFKIKDSIVFKLRQSLLELGISIEKLQLNLIKIICEINEMKSLINNDTETAILNFYSDSSIELFELLRTKFINIEGLCTSDSTMNYVIDLFKFVEILNKQLLMLPSSSKRILIFKEIIDDISNYDYLSEYSNFILKKYPLISNQIILHLSNILPSNVKLQSKINLELDNSTSYRFRNKRESFIFYVEYLILSKEEEINKFKKTINYEKHGSYIKEKDKIYSSILRVKSKDEFTDNVKKLEKIFIKVKGRKVYRSIEIKEEIFFLKFINKRTIIMLTFIFFLGVISTYYSLYSRLTKKNT